MDRWESPERPWSSDTASTAYTVVISVASVWPTNRVVPSAVQSSTCRKPALAIATLALPEASSRRRTE
jgi:hypothetical protein